MSSQHSSSRDLVENILDAGLPPDEVALEVSCEEIVSLAQDYRDLEEQYERVTAREAEFRRDAVARIEELQEQLEAALRVVEAAHIAYDGFGEDDHEFYGSQMRLAEALGAYDERYPAEKRDA